MKKAEIKKAFYIMLWGALGVLFAIVIAGIVEVMSYRIVNRLDIEVVLFATMIFVGIITGLAIAPIAWRKIYVEGARGKKYIIK
jgi:carbon starvation protein CstA